MLVKVVALSPRLCERLLLCLRLVTVLTVLRMKNGGSTARSCRRDKAMVVVVVGNTTDSRHRNAACTMDGRASMILDRSQH